MTASRVSMEGKAVLRQKDKRIFQQTTQTKIRPVSTFLSFEIDEDSTSIVISDRTEQQTKQSGWTFNKLFVSLKEATCGA